MAYTIISGGVVLATAGTFGEAIERARDASLTDGPGQACLYRGIRGRCVSVWSLGVCRHITFTCGR